ncbi:hypothetical protein IFM89_037977 [Coptis chinensis]|uniref:Pre-mRNA-splicing factor ISY1-like protein n=1 Tax=Coptis chinensis TaxID=261450 RepID=A0A835IA10_9MAGN|nr:hypothetical protein IFM89_037977 [Coptis chinensis]
MARNEEKAQSMLNRYITAKNEENKKPKERRPFLTSECRDLSDADKWRQQIMREIEEEDVVEEERKVKEEENQKEQEFVVHVPLPDEREIEKMVLARRRSRSC